MKKFDKAQLAQAAQSKPKGGNLVTKQFITITIMGAAP